MKKVAFFIAAIVIPSLPAFADDPPKQTPENAHRFLKIVVEQNGMEFEQYTPGTDTYGHAPFNLARFKGKDARNPDLGSDEWPVVDSYYYVYPMKVEELNGDDCSSRISLAYDPYTKMFAFNTWGDLNPYNRDKRGRSIPQSERILDIEFLPDLRQNYVVLDWSKVSEIKVEESGDKALISVMGGGRFTLPTKDLAKRVQFAMEFLKNACDPTASTGF